MSAERVRSRSGRFVADVAEPVPSPVTVFAEGLAGQVDILRTVAEAANGYRRTLVEQGWSEHIVEQAAGMVLIHLQGAVLGIAR